VVSGMKAFFYLLFAYRKAWTDQRSFATFCRLIDEISLIIPSDIDGGTGLASAFDDSEFAANHGPKPLSLIDVQRLDGDCIWLRYQTK
jgi:riboflavin biosynthesis pyrimidine reductase